MKKYWFILFCCTPFISLAQKPIKITSNPSVEFQIIDGFGASDAWRAQFVGKNWPLEKRNKIADLLFSQEVDDSGNPRGIGLSIWRFYISSGTTEQGASSDIRNPWRRGECFLNPDGSYDWTKLEGQRWFLNAAKERGVERLLAFPNAAPVYLSNNGKGYATKGDIHFNVKPGYIRDYAKFLVDVLEHFNQEGLFFNYLSPVNEPQWNWDEASQEGTPALNEEIYTFVKYLSSELTTRKLKTQIVIGEAGTIGHASMEMESMGMKYDGRNNQAQFFFNEASPFYIGSLPNVEKTISAHSYQSVWPIDKQVEYRILLNNRLNQVNPELGYWQSEYCILQKNGEIGQGGGRDLGMATAMYVARIMHNDLTLCNAKSWQWWTAISQVDFKDGLVYLDDGSEGNSGKMGGDVESLQLDGAIRESKLLWILGNYSRFIRPGMVRIKCDLQESQSIENGLLISAFKNKTNDGLIYILTNLSQEKKQIDLGMHEDVSMYITSEDQNLEHHVAKANKLIIPQRSVVTIVR